MATTRIMPLHVGKDRTESRAISDIIDYVANPKKTDNGRLITGYACDSRTADAEFLLAKRQYIAATGRVRGADDVIAYHVRQSFRPGEISPEEANRLGESRPHGQPGRRIWIGRFAGSSLQEESAYPTKENSHKGRAAQGQSAGGHPGEIAGRERCRVCPMG